MPNRHHQPCSKMSPKLSHIFRGLIGLSMVLMWSTLTMTIRTFRAEEEPVVTTTAGSSSQQGASPYDFFSQQQQKQKLPRPERKKPRMFLHIGPHKSATTSIQCALYHYGPQLRNDSMVFLGKVDAGWCNFGKIQQDSRIRTIDKCIKDESCWTNMTQEWKDYAKQGIDMVLSKEVLSDWASSKHSKPEFRERFWGSLGSALQGWNVTVLLTYRRYFDWLPSAFNQHAYHTRLQTNQPWPRQDEPVETFENFLIKVQEGTKTPPYPFLDDILEYSFPPSWKVHIMDLEESEDIVSTLICDVLQANYTCQNYQPLPPSRESSIKELMYDYINIQGLHWGWMRLGKRGTRMRATRDFLDQYDMSNVAYDCPDHMLLNTFLDHSLELERKILGNVTDEEEHSWRFWKGMKKFCTVNATKLLLKQPEQWKKFYQSLK
jgi:hypothetical protein